MIDIWFKNDLQKIYKQHSVAIFIDVSGNADFLLNSIEKEITIYQVNSEIEELHVKYLIEKAQTTNEKFLIYTHTKKGKLKFIREYCETCGNLEIPSLQNYIKKNLLNSLNLNINFPEEDLIAASKVSVGKDKKYWIDLINNGPTGIFDLNKELLPFLNNPERYSTEKFDAQLMETFYRKVNELLGQEYFIKPALTLANEVVKFMLDGLINNSCNDTLFSVYNSWLDSITCKDSFNNYLSAYILTLEIDLWNTNINHPFKTIDENWLKEIGSNISDKPTILKKLEKVKLRNKSKQAKALGINFWSNIIELLEFNPKDISKLNSLNECIDYYKHHFHKLDAAIRNLYCEFLNNTPLLAPFQELYKNHVTVFLDKWFMYWTDYKETQTGTIQKIINQNKNIKTAIIVGDGVTLEIAEEIASKVHNKNLIKNEILADTPSQTENNMSRIYMDNGITEATHINREKYLKSKNTNITLDFIKLNEFNGTLNTTDFLICTHKDFDTMGEHFQQNSLQYFNNTINLVANKISKLLTSGYAKVYLISDHGFVLTGLLMDSDKISVSFNGEIKKAERYIRTEDKQMETNLIEKEISYNNFRYLYFAKNMNPFKTPGVYGFSHGGITPQELITPYFCWANTNNITSALSITIVNKQDLKSVPGNLFSIKIQSSQSNDSLLSTDRKVYLSFFAKNTIVNKSDIFTIQKDQQITKEYNFDGNPEIEVQILDAITKEKLDYTNIKQNKDRDLGGLL